PQKTALLLVNQHAGTGTAKEKVFLLITELTKLGYEVITYPIIPEAGITSEGVVKEYLKQGIDLVACIGGDGTLNHVVNALLTSNEGKQSKTPIVYLPSGTTNDYAKTLGLNGDVEKIIKSVSSGKVFRLDVGDFSQKFFNYVAAFGAFTNVSYETPQDQKNFLGYFAYVLNAIAAAPSSLQTRYTLSVSHDSETEEGTFIFGAVSNATSVAGFKTQALSDASLSDGLFEAMLIKAPDDLMDVGEIIRSAMDGNFDNPYIRMFQAKEVHFHSEEDINWTLDGEFGGTLSDVTIRVLPKAIKIYTEL
ncbi:BmrU protein, partial [Lachnospiraceae bacterium JC7]